MQPQDHPSATVRALLESTGTAFTTARYPPRAALFVQGDPCDSVMHIEKGRVWVAVTSPGGKEAICGLLAAGAFLGEEALLGHPVRPHTATAMTPTEVLVVAKASVSRLLHTQPAIAHRFIAHVIARNAHLKADLTDQLLLPVERRLAHTLLALAGCDTRIPCRCALPDVPQRIIAEMVGTTRSRVNFFMRQFKKRGFVAEDDGVLAVNRLLLRGPDNGHRHTSHAASLETI